MRLFKISISLVIFLLLGEFLSYAYFFHKNSQAFLGWEKVTDKVMLLIKKNQLRFQLSEHVVKDEVMWEKFYTNKENYMSKVQLEFGNLFNEFVTTAEKLKTEILIIFIPQTNPKSSYNCSEKPSRNFFQKLAKNNNKKFVDLTDALNTFEYKYTTLYPHDFHLSRFGNYIVAEELSQTLKDFTNTTTPNPCTIKSYRSTLGHFGSSKSKSMDIYGTPSVRINQIGIRSQRELDIPKKKLRVGCLGDSFTFGHGVLDDQTYPHILSNLNQEIEILNFGVPGTTIVSHLDILKNLDGLGLDLVIIQFGDNDLIDLMTHRQEIFSRIKPTKRTKEETNFLRKLSKI